MLKVAIASLSPDKIEGVKEAFLQFFSLEESKIEFCPMQTESGVPEQPFGEETYKGAQNRVKTIMQLLDADYYISCEAGIEEVVGQYFNVQVVCIFDSKLQEYLWGKSAGWSIPPEAIEEIKKSNLDSYLRGKGITSIEELLGHNNSRSSAVAQGAALALASRKLLEQERQIGNGEVERAAGKYAKGGVTQEELHHVGNNLLGKPYMYTTHPENVK